MIDIHCHILPGVDDGAASLEETLAMVRQAAASGTTDLVATPHASHQFAFDPSRADRLVGEVQRAAGEIVRIHGGCEMHFTPENIDCALSFPERYSIGGRGYLLVEFSDHLVPRSSGEILARMISRGLRPIIAHPERNPILRTAVLELEGWVRQGCLLQVTAQSLTGRFGKSAEKAGREWLTRGLIHFIASDGHDCRHRPPVLAEAWRYVQQHFGTGIARRLFLENPQAALAGTPDALEPARVRKKRSLFSW